MLIRPFTVFCFVGLLSSSLAFAYEDSKVMPAKIRRLTFRFVNTDISEKTDGGTSSVPLSRPLNKALTFNDILKGEKDPVRHSLTSGFLAAEGFNPSDSVGQFVADVKTRVQVSAPIFALGLTSSTTLAVAVPIYNMQTAAEVSFQANEMGQKFVNNLASDFNNQMSSARDAASKLNDAVARLNTKLVDNGYRPLESWQGSGLGDAQLVMKHKTYAEGALALATQGVITAPTGRVDDPDNLLDKGFGDGQWDVALGATAEQSAHGLYEGLSLTQYVRYTYQMPGERTVRLVTSSETIEVPKQKVSFDLGDRVETGAAALIARPSGWGAAIGYNYTRKAPDKFDVPVETRRVVERDTLEMQHQAEAELVFSGVPAFRRGSIPVPFELKLGYKHQLASRNMPVTHLVQIDTGIFF